MDSYALKEVQQILCAIYTRLSKEDEDKQQPESESIQNQKSLLTRYAVDHGWDIYSIFCDEECSGTNELYMCEKESLICCMGLSGSLF